MYSAHARQSQTKLLRLNTGAYALASIIILFNQLAVNHIILFQVHKLTDSELGQMYRFQGVSIPAEIRV